MCLLEWKYFLDFFEFAPIQRSKGLQMKGNFWLVREWMIKWIELPSTLNGVVIVLVEFGPRCNWHQCGAGCACEHRWRLSGVSLRWSERNSVYREPQIASCCLCSRKRAKGKSPVEWDVVRRKQPFEIYWFKRAKHLTWSAITPGFENLMKIVPRMIYRSNWKIRGTEFQRKYGL